MYGLGPKVYFKSAFNRFDCAVSTSIYLWNFKHVSSFLSGRQFFGAFSVIFELLVCMISQARQFAGFLVFCKTHIFEYFCPGISQPSIKRNPQIIFLGHMWQVVYGCRLFKCELSRFKRVKFVTRSRPKVGTIRSVFQVISTRDGSLILFNLYLWHVWVEAFCGGPLCVITTDAEVPPPLYTSWYIKLFIRQQDPATVSVIQAVHDSQFNSLSKFARQTLVIITSQATLFLVHFAP